MGVLLCLLLTVHIRITRARTYLKMVPYTKIILALLVILNTAQALPVSQKPDEVEGIAIPVDEAKEITYELNRNHDLQGSMVKVFGPWNKSPTGSNPTKSFPVPGQKDKIT